MPRTLIFGIVLASIPTTIRAQNTPLRHHRPSSKRTVYPATAVRRPQAASHWIKSISHPVTLRHGSELFGSCALALCLQWRPPGPTAGRTSPRSLH